MEVRDLIDVIGAAERALDAPPHHYPVLATEPEGQLAAIVNFTSGVGAGRLQRWRLRRRLINLAVEPYAVMLKCPIRGTAHPCNWKP